MLARPHLNKYLDVQKHALVYKKVKVSNLSYSKAEAAAKQYFANMGTLWLFRYVGLEAGVDIFEGVAVVINA